MKNYDKYNIEWTWMRRQIEKHQKRNQTGKQRINKIIMGTSFSYIESKLWMYCNKAMFSFSRNKEWHSICVYVYVHVSLSVYI